MIPFHYQYEHEIIRHHSTSFPDRNAWHWSVIPEDILFECGYIHDYNKTRLERLKRKKDPVLCVNRVNDYGFDGLAKDKFTGTFFGLQAKAYNKRKVRAEDIGSFLTKQYSLTLKNPQSVGYLYTLGDLEINLKEELDQPNYLIKHCKYKWEPNTLFPNVLSIDNSSSILECDIILREDQQIDLDKLNATIGINALVKPCGTGKTVICGNHIRIKKPNIIIAIAPLKSSVENLEDRLPCFLPGYDKIIVDSDYDGTTNEKEIMDFLRLENNRIIFSTYKSTQDLLSKLITDIDESYFIVVDEVHNVNEELCNFINKFKQGLVMSAVIPYEVMELLNIKTVVKTTLKEAIDKEYIVPYTLWLPYIEEGCDGYIPNDFDNYKKDLLKKAFYNANSMLKTGSRKCIVYLTSSEECDEYMRVIKAVFEEYHGCDVLCTKIDSNVNKKKRKEILTQFQSGETNVYHILTSIRILDEAIDIPKCDSVFITHIGEHSSDIRLLQRTMRSSRKDVNNPSKHNNIFLWTDDLNNCVYALDMIKESDSDFHKKIRMIDTDYNKSGNVKRIEKIKTETIKTIQRVEITCMTVYDKIVKKVNELLIWTHINKRILLWGDKNILFTDGTYMYNLWDNCKQLNKCTNEPYSKLLTNDILKENYESVQLKKELKKGRIKLTIDSKITELITKVEELTMKPSKGILFSDGSCMYNLWDYCKREEKCTNEPYSKLLTNDILKEDYESVQLEKELKKGRIKLTIDSKITELITKVEELTMKPSKGILFSDGSCMYYFWDQCKRLNKCTNEPYSKLLTNDILKEDYESFQLEKERKR